MFEYIHFHACLFSIVLICLGGVNKSFKLYFEFIFLRDCFISGLKYLLGDTMVRVVL